jgi:hypothetical protein
MVTLLDDSTIDPISTELDAYIVDVDAEEQEAAFEADDLNDDDVPIVNIIPTMHGEHGTHIKQGRAAARQVWTWDGAPSLIPLAWNPDGTVHDSGKAFMTKRHCLCCNDSGFRTAQCRRCKQNNCPNCRGSRIKEKVIPNFYLRKSDVPYAQKVYGEIDCFLPTCPRKGAAGFITEEDMRLHAIGRHKLQYEVFQSTQESKRQSEIDDLKGLVNILLAGQVQQPAKPGRTQLTEEQVETNKARMEHARASRYGRNK